MSKAYKCPRCKKYIFDTYCVHCNKDVRDYNDIIGDSDLPDFFKDFFKKGNHDDNNKER